MKHIVEEIYTDQAPSPVGFYSQAVKAGHYIFCSGQIGLDPLSHTVAGSLTEQTEQVLKNLEAVLLSAKSGLHQVVKTEIYLTDIDNFEACNAVYEKYFTSHPKPARITVGVAQLPKNALIEISCTAFIPEE